MDVEHYCNYQFCCDTDVENYESDYQGQNIDLLRINFTEDNLKITLFGTVEEVDEITFFSDLKVNFNRPQLVAKISRDKIDVVVNLMNKYKFEPSLKIEYQRQLLEHLE